MWNVVAPSLLPDDTSLTSSLSSLGTFGQDWIAWRWNPSSGRWEAGGSLPGRPASADAFSVGTPWWIAVDGDGGNVSVPVAGEATDPTSEGRVALEAGWNLVANPFAFAVAWSDEHVKIRHAGEELTPSAADTAGWIENRVIWWDGGARRYVVESPQGGAAYVMPPVLGHWLYAGVDGAELAMQPIGVDPPDDAIPVAPTADPAEVVSIRLWAENTTHVDEVEAVATRASESRRAHERKPPAPPGPEGPSLSIVATNSREGAFAATRLAKPLAESMEWEVRVGGPIGSKLGWEARGLPAGYSALLHDTVTGDVVDIRHAGRLDIGGRSQRPLILRLSRVDAPTRTAVFPNYPNPFNPDTWIPFSLAEASDVVIRIYDVTGRFVRDLRLGHRAPGIYHATGRAAHWDGRNSDGEPVASGVYIYEIEAGTTRSKRKMAVLK
ncbi:T9SS type A sorting domain-containing protein [Candidatus Poribacteria bacterium]|nr:T9SS type A sorting domain-containing protein [Candidatus Poribacteria bacterium]